MVNIILPIHFIHVHRLAIYLLLLVGSWCFSIFLGMSSSQVTNILFRDVEITNQIMVIYLGIWMDLDYDNETKIKDCDLIWLDYETWWFHPKK